MSLWCVRIGRPGTEAQEDFPDSAVDAFEAYAEAEAAVRLGERPWAQLWSPRGNCEAECDAPAGWERAARMVETAYAG